MIQETTLSWYAEKHRRPTDNELKFINSIDIRQCHRCGCSKIRKDGFTRSGLQLYYCNFCHHRFTPLTNIIFDGKKIPISEWMEYLEHLFYFHSIKSSAYFNRNAEKTGKYWLVKVFSVLKHIQDKIILNGGIYLDETYIQRNKDERETKDGKELRGISRNKLGIGVATNKSESIFIATGTSKPSKASTWRTYGSHIANNSMIIHDGEKSHSILIEKLNLTSTVHTTKETKGLPDKKNPLNPVNRLHFLVKSFLRAHGGFNKDNLQDYLNLFWFIMNGPEDDKAKVDRFIELAVLSPSRVKYREVFPKKH